MRLLAIIAAILVVVPMYSTLAAGLSPDDAMNELSSESALCAAYYGITFNCFDQSGQLQGEARASTERTRDAAVERYYVTTKGVGLSEKAAHARFELAVKAVINDIDKSCKNISVLLNKYAAQCKALMEHPEQRLQELMTKGPEPQ